MSRSGPITRALKRRALGIRAIPLLIVALFPAALAAQTTYGHYQIHESDPISRNEYADRRNRALEKIGLGSAILVRAAEVRNRSNDIDYEYRQRNGMLYLTGVTEAESALLLVRNRIEIEGSETSEILFVSPRDPKTEKWNGIRMGAEVASQVTGIATVLTIDKLRAVLDELLPELDTIYYDDWTADAVTEPLTGDVFLWGTEMRRKLAVDVPRLQVVDAGPMLERMRMVKSEAEIELLRRAVEITVEGHRQTIRQARPGMHEYELEAIMEYTFHRMGAEAPGYPSIVGSGPNSCILHYETNRRKTEPGDLVLMDCGAEYHGYTADLTRTIPIGGTFTPEQREIYDLVLLAQEEGIAACRSGNRFRATHDTAVAVLARGLIRLGIIESPAEVTRYFMHGTSHCIGLDVHDVPTVVRGAVLEPGVLLTVEPGVYIPAGSPCDRKWWNIGVRIEDNILVTKEGPVNLSAALARTADEIERLMGETP